jgi:hypothetical protein
LVACLEFRPRAAASPWPIAQPLGVQIIAEHAAKNLPDLVDGWRSKIEVAQVGAAASGTSPSSCCAADRRDTVKRTGYVTDRASAETNDFERVIVLG